MLTDEQKQQLRSYQITDEKRNKIREELHTRTLPVDRAKVNTEDRTVPMSFSSDAPIMRWWGVEILSHKPECIRMDRWNRGAAFLMDHNPYDQRGIILDGKLENNCLTGKPKISRTQRGEELMMDIQDGIRPYTSIGYAIHSLREISPEEMTPAVQTMCLENKCGAYEADDWEPLEGSSVSVPADTTVGMGRSLQDYYKQPAEPVGVSERSQSQPPKERITMEKETTTLTPEQTEAQEKQRVAALEAIAKRFGDRIAGGKAIMDQLVKAAIELGRSEAAFKGDVYVRVNDSLPLETPDSELGMEKKQVQQYSLLRLIQSQLDPHFKADFERECSDAIIKKSSRHFNGLAIPWEIQNRSLDLRIGSQLELDKLRMLAMQAGLHHAARALTSTTATGAAELVGSNLRADLFVELLRNRAVAGLVGVQILFGLQGNLILPKQSGAATWEWTGETGTTTGSALTTTSITLSPHEGRAYQEYYRMLLLQSTPSIELLVQNDLFTIARLGIDKAVFHGSNAANQPKGIINETGIGAVTAAGLGWDAVVDFETKVAAANADVQSMFYVTNPTLRGTMKTRPKVAGQPTYLMTDRGEVNGYPSIISGQISAKHIFFGDFSQELLAYFGNLDLLVNPYVKDNEAITRVNIYADIDCALRQAGAISAASDAD